jgi:hypothetical protein
MASTTATTTLYPSIERIVELDTHNLELLSDGSVDIVDADTLGEKEYTHLEPEEARQLFPALVA